MSGLFKSLTEYFGNINQMEAVNRDGEVFIGQVLDVIKNTTVGPDGQTVADTPRSVGMIRFNRASVVKQPEANLTEVAEPLDRSNYRLPFAGEEVLLVRRSAKYYYFSVVTPNSGIANNVNPTLLEDAYKSSNQNKLSIDPAIEAQRFELRSDFEPDTLKRRTTLPSKVREGDTIMEGRFGGVIKLTHTITKENIWNPTTQITNIGQSLDGDPMLVMRSSRKSKAYTEFEGTLEDDDINAEDASFYLTTTQRIPLSLGASNKCYSWIEGIQTPSSLRGPALVTADENSTTLDAFNPGRYDPSKPVDVIVNISGANLSAGGGGGGGAMKPPIPNGKHIVIGDSLTPSTKAFSKKVGLLSDGVTGAEQGGEPYLWQGGKTVKWLVTALGKFTAMPNIQTVVICIGSNDLYKRNQSQTTTFINLLKEKFPNANLIGVMGTWGWTWGTSAVCSGGEWETEGTGNIPPTVTTYYSDFIANGVRFIKTPIGYSKEHPGSHKTVSFKSIGPEIDAMIP